MPTLWPQKGETVVSAMSGGVDSSVATALLVRRGYSVIAITLRLGPELEEADACRSPEFVEDAKQVAEQLGVAHHVLDYRSEFESAVISNFLDEYGRGRTPNPCVICNERVKFGGLLQKAFALGGGALATGHYARVERCKTTGRYLLRRAKDVRKDQTYFLYRLSQEQLSKAVFPLADMEKAEVRDLAKELSLKTSNRPESQDICFVTSGDYRSFLTERREALRAPGDIVDKEGQVLGTHRGIAFYTVGQRRRLGLRLRKRLFVTEIRPELNQIVVGTEDELQTSSAIIGECNFISVDRPSVGMRVQTVVRYKSNPVSSRITGIEGDRVEIEFEEPIGTPSPGQSGVFYQDDVVVGGGFIEG